MGQHSGEEVGAPAAPDAALVLAGIDLIFSSVCGWVVLEVNDCPSGLADADIHGCHVNATRGIVRSVALALARRASSDCVGLLLPDAFRIHGKTSAQTIALMPGDPTDDLRTTSSIADFNALAAELRRLGKRVVITARDGLRMSGSDVMLTDGTRVGVLYRRTHEFPPREPRCACVNDLRARVLCLDKSRTAALLRTAGLAVPRKITSRASASSPWIIVKPNFGSGSAGVMRIRADDPSLLYHLRKRGPVVQEWIEPAMTRLRGRSHYFDVRVYVVDEQVVGRVARLAAAPHDESLFATSPLSWLTTTGRWRPLTAMPRKKASEVSLPRRHIAELDAVCQRAVRTLNRAARDLKYESTARWMRSLRTGLALHRSLDPIELAPI